MSNKIIELVVRNKRLAYKCYETHLGWKCGKCTRGKIKPIHRSKCKVCGASVFRAYSISYESDGRYTISVNHLPNIESFK